MSEAKQAGVEEAFDLLERAPGKRPHFLEEGALDHMFTMIIELASSVSVLKERLYAYEALIEEAGLLSKHAVEGWTPSEAQAEELRVMRQDLIKSLFRSVTASEPSKVMPTHTDDPTPPT